MAKEKKLVQSITSRDEDFAQWYTDVVREAKLCDYSGVKGCLNYLPNGYALWENIQADLDKRFKDTGVENVYLPVLIPESLLQKEKDHIEGFAPEVAWVTHGGMEPLQERFCIRPTSETLFCDVWSKTVQSYRDLPKVWNQWCSVLRWEKTTRPFLRSREFLWQEGHTIHATYEEAEERTKMMWEVYKSFVEEDLAIPVVAGRKTESEKFAGAQDTYTIEALMHDGQALQSATSHFFGNAFPDAFNIKYADKNNELHSVYETSWGLSTRIIGAIIMVHGDDSGLVLPPRIAPVQTRVIPIAQHKEGVLDKANELLDALKAAGYRAKIDDSEKSPGWKFSEQEMLGIPTRIEIGPKDIENGQVVVVRRDTREKIVVAIDEITTKLGEILETIQKDLYAKAKAFLEDHISEATTLDEMKDAVQNKKGFVKAMWCGEEACEDEIKAQTGGVTSRCIPMEEEGDSPAERLEYQKKIHALYEEFVRAWFRKERPDLFANRRNIPWALDDDSDPFSKTLLPQMEGDLILRSGDSVLVVDAKLYSRALSDYYGKETFHSANLYQILSYVRNGRWGDHDQVDGLLLYARTREQREAKGDFHIEGHRIHVRSLDLSGEWESVERTMEEVASLVGGGSPGQRTA